MSTPRASLPLSRKFAGIRADRASSRQTTEQTLFPPFVPVGYGCSEEIQAFLAHLARQGSVVLSTEDQALRAILFFYRQLLGIERPWLDGIEPAKKPQRSAVTLTPEDGCDPRRAQKLPGHEGVSTTMSDRLVLIGGGRGVVSPLDW